MTTNTDETIHAEHQDGYEDGKLDAGANDHGRWVVGRGFDYNQGYERGYNDAWEAKQAENTERRRCAIFKIGEDYYDKFEAECRRLNITIKEKAGVYQGADTPLPATMQPYFGNDLNGNGVLCPLVRFNGDPDKAQDAFNKLPYNQVHILRKWVSA